MARASLRMDVSSRGASLQTVARELRAMDDRQVTALFKRRLEPAAEPFVRAVQASVLALPVIPDGPQTGLRARIAACASVSSWTDARSAGVSVFMDTAKMPSGERSLPLGMEGAKRWRHPVFGNRENWVTEPPKPYFYQAVAGFGTAAGAALRAALQDITRKING